MTDAIVLADPEPGWVSGSALAAAVNCAASAVLPRILGTAVGATKIGSALHEHVRQRNMLGVAGALDMLADVARRFDLDEAETSLFIARARAFEWNPPRGSVAELALCLFEDGSVRVVEGGKGAYVLPPDALIPSQIDLFWAEPDPLYRDGDRIVCPPTSILWAVDFKSGKEDYVAPAERNAQALAGAVLAAKFTGARAAIPGIVYLRKGQGIWDVADHPLDARALADVERALAGAVLEVRRQRERRRTGLPLVYREGVHCNMCRAAFGCPARLATLKSWLSDPAPIEPGALNDAQVRRLAELAPAFSRFAASVNAVLRRHVEDTGRPIVLSDGRVWGPHATARTTYETDALLSALGELVDPKLAQGALRRSVPKKAIEKAIDADHKAKGLSKQKASTLRRLHVLIEQRGGLRTTTKTQWGVHKPKAELPPETSARLAALHAIPIDGDEEEDDDDE